MAAQIGTRIRFRCGNEVHEATVESHTSRGVWARYDEPLRAEMATGGAVLLASAWVIEGQYEEVS